MKARKSILAISGMVLVTACLLFAGSQNPLRESAPSKVADGGDPMPNPYPKPPATIVADGGDPMPNPYPKPPASLLLS